MELSYFNLIIGIGIVGFLFYNALIPLFWVNKAQGPSEKSVLSVIETAESVIEATDLGDGDFLDFG